MTEPSFFCHTHDAVKVLDGDEKVEILIWWARRQRPELWLDPASCSLKNNLPEHLVFQELQFVNVKKNLGLVFSVTCARRTLVFKTAHTLLCKILNVGPRRHRETK